MEQNYINCESDMSDETYVLNFTVFYKGIKLFGKIIGGGNIDVNYDSLDVVIDKIKNNNIKDVKFYLRSQNNIINNYVLLIKNDKFVFSTGYCSTILEIPIVKEFHKGLLDLFNKLKLINNIT